ncbi:YhdP family protein [Chromatiaceae bacterium AAb-1]|nr:YhdP family protein [Chromatiaceae bacterium AAb-1]
MQAKRVCFYCFHKLWLLLAVGLVLLATVVSVLRYSLPYADNYKHRLEQLITAQYGANIRIGELSAAWQKFGPSLLLRDVHLISGQEELHLQIAETRVRLDFWRSLLNWQLTAEHFELVGLTYYLDSDSLHNNELPAAESGEPLFNALEQLFFHQLKNFSVLDSQLILQSQYDPDLVINIKTLDWRNQDNRHQGFGELSIAGVTANNLSFILDLYGRNRDETFGQLYLESDRLDVLPLFRQLLPQTQRLDQASINFRAWGKVDNGALQRIQIDLSENSLYWRRDGKRHQLQLGQGQLLWLPAEDGWSLYSNRLTLTDQKQQWPELVFQLHRYQQQWQGSLQNFQLEALTPLAHLLADDISQVQSWLTYQVSGHLEQLNWKWAQQQWYASGEFSGLTSAPVRDIPGVQQIGGDFLASQEFSKLYLHSTDGELLWDDLFARPFSYQELAATVYLKQDTAQSWQLQIPEFVLRGNDLELAGAMLLDHQHQLSLLARVQQSDVARAENYFPLRYMPQTVREYLQPAIISGELANTAVLWHGKLQDFPYQEQQGIFQVSAEVKNASFQFAPDWPLLTGLDAGLLFENAAMTIQSYAGTLAGLPLQDGVTATIPDLFHADELLIDISRQLDASQVQALMLQSPLAGSLGKTLEHLGLSGQVDGQLRLAVDLRSPAVNAVGEVALQQATMTIAAPDMFVSEVSGKVRFENEKIASDQLTLNWRGLPLQASVQGAQGNDAYQVALKIQGAHQAAELFDALYPEGAELAEGISNWQLQLALQLPQQGFAYQAELTADLQNTELKLPAPYQKIAGTEAGLYGSISGNEQQSQLVLNYDNKAYFHAEAQDGSQQFNRAHLTLGPADQGLSSPDFGISVDLDYLDFLPWLELISQQVNAIPGGENPLLPPLQQVRGKVKQLQAAPGVMLHNTVFEVQQQPELWLLQLNGNEVASRWQLFKDWQQQGIYVAFDYLHLPVPEPAVAEQQARSTSAHWMTELPPLTVTCADCAIGPYRLGEVTAKAHSTDDSWQLSVFRARYKRNELNITGGWQEQGESRFQGKLSSPNIGALLHEYQLTSAISGSRTELDFALHWPGAPQQFTVAGLNGKLNFNLAEGSLTEVSDQGARLFSLFSLDSLVRKLRLDFRDIFSKGFFYNKMSGSVLIENGIAQTSDTAIDGVPGNLSLQGYADLANQTMDYQAAFAPKVTSSLPVIIAWMVNPVTGLAALALDEVFQSAEVISRINFTITGDFKNPVVTEVNRHSKEVPVPVRVAQPEPVPVPPEEQKPHG